MKIYIHKLVWILIKNIFKLKSDCSALSQLPVLVRNLTSQMLTIKQYLKTATAQFMSSESEIFTCGSFTPGLIDESGYWIYLKEEIKRHA